MNLFEFLMVLVSIIIGLGIAEILSGAARALRWRETFRPYWIHTVLVAAIFVAHLQIWWESWGLRDVGEWTFGGLLMMLGGPVALFLIAHLLFPEPMKEADARSYYYGSMEPVWWLGAVAVVVATTFRPMIFGGELLSLDNVQSLVVLVGFVTLARVKRPALHAGAVPVLFLLLLMDILRWTPVIATG